jgi:hypothetical protein
MYVTPARVEPLRSCPYLPFLARNKLKSVRFYLKRCLQKNNTDISSPGESARFVPCVISEGPGGECPSFMVWLVCCIHIQVEERLNCTTGTRWLTRWDKEVDLLVKLVYYGFTTGRGVFYVMRCLFVTDMFYSRADTRRGVHRYMAILLL